jgi:LPPG:FO 2-phospho-L-lactate transferase
MITALCGGVGGSKLAFGLYRALPPDELTVLVNTADDVEFCGLHVSPDVDTVTYTLAGLARPDVGWGVAGDTFNALEMLARYGAPTWFQVGDRDLATIVLRTEALRAGRTLSDITRDITQALGIRATVLPMTDDRIATKLLAGDEWIDFQEYFVHRRHAVPVDVVQYQGMEHARPTAAARTAIEEAELIVFVNSNPVLSLLPMLALPGVRSALKRSSAPCVAVSPIVGDDAVAGPAGVLMKLLNLPTSAVGVARAYQGLIGGIVIDRRDERMTTEIEGLGIAVLCTDVIMRSDEDKERLARETLDFARSL